MAEDGECASRLLANVKGADVNGKLLFQLICEQGEIAILIKIRGIKGLYCIPIRELLEPFCDDIQKMRDCTRWKAYEEGGTEEEK